MLCEMPGLRWGDFFLLCLWREDLILLVSGVDEVDGRAAAADRIAPFALIGLSGDGSAFLICAIFVCG